MERYEITELEMIKTTLEKLNDHLSKASVKCLENSYGSISDEFDALSWASTETLLIGTRLACVITRAEDELLKMEQYCQHKDVENSEVPF